MDITNTLGVKIEKSQIELGDTYASVTVATEYTIKYDFSTDGSTVIGAYIYRGGDRLKEIRKATVFGGDDVYVYGGLLFGSLDSILDYIKKMKSNCSKGRV